MVTTADLTDFLHLLAEPGEIILNVNARGRGKIRMPYAPLDGIIIHAGGLCPGGRRRIAAAAERLVLPRNGKESRASERMPAVERYTPAPSKAGRCIPIPAGPRRSFAENGGTLCRGGSGGVLPARMTAGGGVRGEPASRPMKRPRLKTTGRAPERRRPPDWRGRSDPQRPRPPDRRCP